MIAPPDRRLWLAAAGAAGCLPTILCVSALNNIVLRNLHDIPYDRGTVAIFAGGFALLTVALLPVFLTATRYRGARAVGRLVIGLALAVVVFNVLGSARWVETAAVPVKVVVDLFIGVLVAVLLARAPWAVVVRVSAVVSAVLFAHGVGTHVISVWDLSRVSAQRAVARSTGPESGAPARSDVGNVYHVVLDAFQSEAYAVLTGRDATLHLDDFAVYPTFIANYATTAYSLPCTLAGGFYAEGQSMWDWREGAMTRGVWWRLSRAGVGVAAYPYFDRYCSAATPDCSPAIAAAREAIGGAGRSSRRLVTDLWFVSLLPPSVRTVLGPGESDAPVAGGGAGFSITDRLWPRPVLPPGSAARDMVEAGSFATLSIRNFERLLAEEAARPSRGQYVFAHLVVPHWPYMVDGGCGYTGRRPFHAGSVDDYLAQAECALRMIQQLTDELRRLGRYDDALIIVHGDHGMDTTVAEQLAAAHGEHMSSPEVLGLGPMPARRSNSGFDYLPAHPWTVRARSRALLAIKFPKGTTAPHPQPSPQLVDIAPSILHHWNVDGSGLRGRPIQTDPGTPREVAFYFGLNRLDIPGPRGYVPHDGVFHVWQNRDGAWTRGGVVPVSQ